MDNHSFALAAISGSLTERQAADRILSCNEELKRHGLVLTEEQAVALSRTRTNALRETGRVEFSGGIVDRLVLAFCDSPYVDGASFDGTLHELIGLFYEMKNDTNDAVSDDDIIVFMKNAYNNRCHGSLELLAGEAMRLSEHINRGGKIGTYREDNNGDT